MSTVTEVEVAASSEEVCCRCVPLDDVCVTQTGIVDPTRKPEEPFRYVDISSVDNQRKRIVEGRTLLGKNAPSRARQLIRTNDVLVSTTRPNLNAVAIVPPELDGAICSTGFCVLRSAGAVSPEYLFAFVQSARFVSSLSELVKGALYPAVNDGQVRQQRIPLLDRDKQEQIASRLRSQLAEVERARAAVEEQLKAAEALPAAFLRAVFSKTASNWNFVKIGSVAKVQSGYAFKSEWFSQEGIRLLRNVNVAQGRLRWDDIAKLPMNRRREFNSYELYPGDIILSLDRPFVGSGLKLARVTDVDLPALLLQRVGRFLITGEIDPGYLYAFLQTEGFIRAITAHDHSTGVPHVSPQQVENVLLPLPPIPEQRQLAARLNAEFSKAQQLREHLAQKLAAIEKIPAALLREAFNGK